MTSHPLQSAVVASVLALLAGAVGCDDRSSRIDSDGSAHAGAEPAAPTNRIDIPAAVRQNLGITFATVERRSVAKTLRVPGRFELLPTARREYRAPLSGQVELLASQFQPVGPGTPLYRLDSPALRDLKERIIAMRARVDSMVPLREAHRVHEKSLADKVDIWRERLGQLEELRAAGGGNASQFTEARATLNDTQAELADVMEKDAELRADQLEAEAELRSLIARLDLLVRASACESGAASQGSPHESSLDVCALDAGVVEAVAVVSGGLAEESDLVLSVVRPELVRFRARGLQSDLGRLRDGLPARIAPPQGDAVELQETMSGPLRIGLSADPDERTIDLILEPESLAPWARAGVAAHLEVTLEGGDEDLAIPLSAVVRDGVTPVIFRRDPANPDRVVRVDADLGVSDGRWVVIASGVLEGDQIVVTGNYQLMLASSGSAAKGGHFHPDGTFHEGEH